MIDTKSYPAAIISGCCFSRESAPASWRPSAGSGWLPAMRWDVCIILGLVFYGMITPQWGWSCGFSARTRFAANSLEMPRVIG